MRDTFILRKLFELQLLDEEIDRQMHILKKLMTENNISIIDTQQQNLDTRFLYRKNDQLREAIYMRPMAEATVRGLFRKWLIKP